LMPVLYLNVMTISHGKIMFLPSACTARRWKVALMMHRERMYGQNVPRSWSSISGIRRVITIGIMVTGWIIILLDRRSAQEKLHLTSIIRYSLRSIIGDMRY